MAKLILRHAASQYGAEMGRKSQLPDERQTAVKLHLQKMVIDANGYDQGLAYWGINFRGTSGDMYAAWGEYGDDAIQLFVRARDRVEAKISIVNQFLPNARFYR